MARVFLKALLSVTDKTGLVLFAAGLEKLGIDILASGGTAKMLREADLSPQEVAAYTGSPEIFDGRVKTLHPKIFGGILFERDKAAHQEQAVANGILPIDIVVVNLYRFREAVEKALPFEEIIENIDIGGPSLIRAAAKNHQDVLIIVDPKDYGMVLERLEAGKDFSEKERLAFALKAFEMTWAYDEAISEWLQSELEEN